ncbi:ferritin [Dyella flava]|uniref:Ferritin n=2 Tax=Dyella flava TaxID=1920170 RepID=A0ABS2K2G4_9GAMM|nr:ferritin [Dyella flava]
MLFPSIFARLEENRWNLGTDIRWQDFDASKLTERQLHGIKMNAILEWSAMPTAEMFLRDNSHDADFSAFISIWFFEEQKHSLVLLKYLKQFAPEFCPTEEELSAVRFSFDSAPPLESLALHFCGEVRLNQWYRCASAYHDEPVIRQIYSTLANDEARHARAYLDYMRKSLKSKTREASLAFAKIGVLMTNARLNKAMHPTNLHVNKRLYPDDTVNGRLPDPEWLEHWLSNEIRFDSQWEKKVELGILSNLSGLLGHEFPNSHALRSYHKHLTKTAAAA